jgi:uncharacterized protein YmfQ (DUF2313 family)
MSAPFYTAADFLAALQTLMPRGRVWPREGDAGMTQALSGLSPVYERHTNRANQLLVDAFPLTTYELLPEWESALGLPDPCAGVGPTLQVRRAQVVARFAGQGGQSVPYIIQYAKNLGYDIEITQYKPARAGMLRAGDPCCGEEWAFAWRVNTPLNTSHDFRAGQSSAGEPLSTIGNTVLECELEAIAPAHTTVFFEYI